MDLKVIPCKKISGKIQVQSDKSISHRSIMLCSLSNGVCEVQNFLESDDCLRTIECFRAMGIKVEKNGDSNYLVYGKGLRGLRHPNDILYVGNSGTLIRLILGILSGQDFVSTITGDESIRQRPMKRVVEPLRKMGATIIGRDDGNFAPLEVKGGKLKAINYDLPIPSAQVKSCLMFASLFAQGESVISEPAASRDHTERLFKYFEIPFSKRNNSIHISNVDEIKPKNVIIPGDISSAAFFIVAALIIPDSEIKITNVGLNPTRTGLLDVLMKMGADIKVENLRKICEEEVGDITAKYSFLKGIEIKGDIIPRIIDEIPIISVAAALADGETIISDAQELRVKESDRIKTTVEELKKIGVNAIDKEDGLVIFGKNKIKGATCTSHGDHRIAMSLAIAGLSANEPILIQDTDCINTSFPKFFEILQNVVVY